MKPKSLVWFLALISLLVAGPAAGQQTRQELVDAALASADASARLDLLVRALDPALGAPDSPWAVAAYSIAFRLLETGQDDEAAHWLRWAAREGAALGASPGDFPALFPPPVVDAFNRARAQVEAQASPGDPAVTSAWEWPRFFGGTSDGVLEVRVEGAGAGVDLEVEGVGAVAPGDGVALPPGTYRILLGGDGVEAVSVRREVLPGTRHILTVSATAVPFPGALARAERSVVRLQRDGGGAQVCATGVAPRAGIVVAPLGMLDGAGLEVVTPDGRTFGNVDVRLRDEALGIGVIRLDGSDLAAFQAAGGAPAGPTWALFHDGCGAVTAPRLDVPGFQAQGRFPVEGAPARSAGAAIVDQEGRLVAMGLGVFALSAAQLDEAVDRALAVVVAEPAPITVPVEDRQQSGGGGGGGGPPWKWILGGAAAVGVAVAVLGGGGSTPPGKTGITIIWPGG